MKLLVTGGREYDNRETVKVVLDMLHSKNPITTLIHGGAKGADALCHEWAADNDVPIVRCPAAWNVYSKSAGPRRNAEMLRHEPNAVVAFPGGSGTLDMVQKSQAAGITTIHVTQIHDSITMDVQEAARPGSFL